MELLLLLVILPAVQDQNHTREWLKNAIRAWCSLAAWIFDLRSYLFGDTPEDVRMAAEAAEQQPLVAAPEQPENQPREEGPPQEEAVQPQDGLAAVHQALMQREGPVGFQPYVKPRMFPVLVRYQ